MEKKKLFCAFCSLECDLAVRQPDVGAYFSEDSIMEQDFDRENVNEGSICARGNFSVDYINHPKRIGYAERRHNKITNDEAFDRIKDGLTKVAEKHGKDSVAIIGNGNMSVEEIELVTRLADALNTKNYGFFLPDDCAVASGLLATGYKFNRPSYEELEKSDNMLIVGDAFYEHPVIAKKLLQARYEDRKHMLFVIDPRYSNTAWFADVHLQCKPGAEGLVLMALAKMLGDGENNEFKKLLSQAKPKELAEAAGVSYGDLEWVAEILGKSENLSILISDIFGKIGNADVCAAYCELIAGGDSSKRHFYPLFMNQSVYPVAKLNSQNGLNGLGKVMDAVVGGKVKGLLTLGVDLLSSFPVPDLKKSLGKLDFFCAADTFRNDTNDGADIVLPLAIPLEKEGTYIDLDGKRKNRETTINPPSAGMCETNIMKKLYKTITGKDAEVSAVEDISELPAVDSYTKYVTSNAEKLLKFKGLPSKKYPFALVPKALPYHWMDGAITRQFAWNQENASEPLVEIHPETAEKLNIKEGQKVTIASEFGKIKLPIAFSKRIKEDVVAADYHWSEIRSLYPLRSTAGVSELFIEPIPVTVGK